jgi:ABC-type multidrug transport system fused ATPase/permease subunit
VIQTLVDVVSKNGNMLLNVIQRPMMSLDAEVEKLLEDDVTAWMKVHGEAIHGTRPWSMYGEGATKTEAGHFKEDFAFSASGIRFTQSKDGGTVYAFALGNPGEKLTIQALKKAGDAMKIAKVELLGAAVYGGAGRTRREAWRRRCGKRVEMRLPVALKVTGQGLPGTGARATFGHDDDAMGHSAGFREGIRASSDSPPRCIRSNWTRMIKVEGLTKRYASYVAVKNISFEVGKGEIVGFRGKNGAGKNDDHA